MSTSKTMRRLWIVICICAVPASTPAGENSSASRLNTVLRMQREPSDILQSGISKKQRAKFQNAIKVLRTSRSGPELARAQRELQKDFPASRPFLAHTIGRDAIRVQAFAVRIIGESGSKKEDLALMARALRSPAESVRRAAIVGAHQFGKGGLGVLKNYLPTEHHVSIRKMAIQTVASWKDPDSLTFFVDLLRKESRPDVRIFIVRALEATSGKRLGDDTESWQKYLTQRSQSKLVNQLKDQDGAQSAPTADSTER